MDLFSTPALARRPAAHLTAAQLPRRSRTIFLIQRTHRPASAIGAALQARGHELIHADSVEGALRVWTKLSAPVHLFLADTALERDHRVEELVKMLSAENPRMRVLYANDLEQSANPIANASYAQQLATVVENCLA